MHSQGQTVPCKTVAAEDWAKSFPVRVAAWEREGALGQQDSHGGKAETGQGYSSYPCRAHLVLSLDRASYHLEQAERGLEVVEEAEEAQRLRCEKRASLVEAVTHNAVMVVEAEELE